MAYVYKVTAPDGKVYVGSTVNYIKRVYSHTRGNTDSQKKLNNSYLKFGVHAHKFAVIIECEYDKMHELEAYYGKLLKCIGPMGLNSSLPSKTCLERVQESVKNVVVGDIILNDRNFKIDKLTKINRFQNEIIKYYLRNTDLSIEDILSISVIQYQQKKEAAFQEKINPVLEKYLKFINMDKNELIRFNKGQKLIEQIEKSEEKIKMLKGVLSINLSTISLYKEDNNLVSPVDEQISIVNFGIPLNREEHPLADIAKEFLFKIIKFETSKLALLQNEFDEL